MIVRDLLSKRRHGAVLVISDTHPEPRMRGTEVRYDPRRLGDCAPWWADISGVGITRIPTRYVTWRQD